MAKLRLTYDQLKKAMTDAATDMGRSAHRDCEQSSVSVELTPNQAAGLVIAAATPMLAASMNHIRSGTMYQATTAIGLAPSLANLANVNSRSALAKLFEQGKKAAEQSDPAGG